MWLFSFLQHISRSLLHPLIKKRRSVIVSAFVILVMCGMCHNAHAASFADGPVFTTIIQPDEKIIIGGYFTSYNGIMKSSIARLNPDGTLDASFDPNMGTDSVVRSIAIQSDNKIIVGGIFETCNGITKNNIVRLNPDGTVDGSFNSGVGANDYVSSIAIQSDGKIIIGGFFTTYNGVTKRGIARLNSDGTLDSGFNSGVGYGSIDAIAIQSDGKIIIGGYFAVYNSVVKNGIARLNSDGTLDSSFNSGSGFEGVSPIVTAISLQTNNKIIIGGSFATYNGVSTKDIIRLNADGTSDSSFDPDINLAVFSTAIQSDGKIIVGGDFDTYNNGVNSHSIARLNIDGTLDTSFDSGVGAENRVRTITIQSDNKIIIGGHFTTYNGNEMNHIALLNVDGSVDPDFGESSTITSPTFSSNIPANTPTNITSTSATGNSEITATGGEDPERIIEWGTTSGVYTNSCTAGIGGIGVYSCNMTNLTPNTTYYVRPSATNSAGTSYGDELSFQTLPSGVPSVSTNDITILNKKSAVLKGEILDIGIENPYGTVEWGTSPGSYTNSCQSLVWLDMGIFSCTATGLVSGETYYYRASAFNVDGINYGEEKSFVMSAMNDPEGWVDRTNPMWWPGTRFDGYWNGTQWNAGSFEAALKADPGDYYGGTFQGSTFAGERPTKVRITHSNSPTNFFVGTTDNITLIGDNNYSSLTELDITYPTGTEDIGRLVFGGSGITKIEFYFPESGGGTTDNANDNSNINLTISENLTLNCGSSVDLDNGTTLTAGTPQTNTTTCQVTTNDQEGYNLSLTDDRTTNNALYHTTQSATQDGQIQDKTPWNNTTPNAQAWTGTGLGFGLLSSTATKNESWWGNANTCNDTTQLYAGLPDTDTNIMEHTTYSNTHTDTVICYKLDIPSTQLSGEYEGSVTYTAAGRP